MVDETHQEFVPPRVHVSLNKVVLVMAKVNLYRFLLIMRLNFGRSINFLILVVHRQWYGYPLVGTNTT